MNLSDLTPEVREKVLGCETPEEILALAREVGHELTDEELEAVAGGVVEWGSQQCPMCLQYDVEEDTSVLGNTFYKCNSCGHRWTDD